MSDEQGQMITLNGETRSIHFWAMYVERAYQSEIKHMKEIARLKAELEAEKAKMKQINMIAWDALHSLHYGEIPRNTLKEEFAKIRGYSDTESEADNEPTP